MRDLRNELNIEGRSRTGLQRFWDKVSLTSKESCWIWTGAKTRQGYGSFVVRSRPFETMLAHRVSWELHNGPIPGGMQVLHTCDNPPCINPAHLYLGNNDDNVADRMEKGRHVSVGVLGERNPQAKINRFDVLTIREEYTPERRKSLALRFGISEGHVVRIARGKSWGWVDA